MSLQQAYNLALQHHQAGRLADAAAIYRQLLARQPDHAGALQMLGVLEHQSGRHQSAVELIHRSIAIQPNDAISHGNLGSALLGIDQPDLAVAALCRALELNANLPIVHYNLGIAQMRRGQFDESIASFNHALRLRPDYPEAHNNLGNALRASGRLDEALAAHQRALRMRPAYPEAEFNVSLVLLLQGKWTQAWPGYEARWAVQRKNPRRDFTQPLWEGEHLSGRSILIHAEQGFGDTLQMIRYIPLVAARGGKIILECQPPLKRLLDGLPGVDQVVGLGEPLPAFDVHLPLMSLPRIFGTTIESIPFGIPYIHPDPELAENWRRKIASDESKLRVGLVWAGQSMPRGRSVPLAALAPLNSVSGVRFYSLQVGPGAAELREDAGSLKMIDRTSEFLDFADTTALLANLDLLITIDTAAAHLAGAMGLPTWVLLSRSPDWRWMLDRADSPWYPTMRLFRQPAPGDWDTPIMQLAAELGRLKSPNG